jgi:CubicO group peptidase (beta-lactamase class C family)/sugar lactone lactonase YvrE
MYDARRGKAITMKHPMPLTRGHLLPVVVAACLVFLAACGGAPPTPPPLPSSPPPVRDYWPTAGWRSDAAANRGMDEAALAGLREQIEQELPFIDSLLIVKDGYLVYEEYFNGHDADRLHHIASVTKSFMSALYGMAQAEGAIPDLDATLGDDLREHFAGVLQPDQRKISLRHLLQMRSGLAFDEEALYEEASALWAGQGYDAALASYTGRDLTGYALGHPMAHRPGEAWSYSTADSQLLSAAFQALTGRSLEAYAGQRLFSALGITEWRWLADAKGVSLGGLGLELTPRDMAKLGFLYLNRGAWDGQELLQPDWVRLTTTPQGSGVYAGTGQTLPIEWYGMQWWTWKPELFAGQRAVAAQGYGGQYVILLPDLDIIVVSTAKPDVPPDVAEDQGNRIYDLVKYGVLPAVTDPPVADAFWAAPDAPPPPAHALYTAGADGRSRRAVLEDPEHSFWGPAWSPDGRQIAFTRAIPAPVSPGSQPAEIYISDRDGGNMQQLTNNGRNNYLPAWSPDGRKIAYISGGRTGFSSHEIYVINADGSNDTRLTDNSAQEYGVSWSPDGAQIAFGTNRDGAWRIYTMKSDGSEQRALPNPAEGNSPSWSPDGSRIAFMSERDGNADIFVMDADGANQQLLAGGEAWDYLPFWSPDGRRIAFASTREGDAAIYVMSADGSGVTRISGTGLAADVASWSPDAERLIFHGVPTRSRGFLEWLRR